MWGIAGYGKNLTRLSLTFTIGDDHYSDTFPNDGFGWNHLATTFDGGTSVTFYVNGMVNRHIDIDAGTHAPDDADFNVGWSSAPPGRTT